MSAESQIPGNEICAKDVTCCLSRPLSCIWGDFCKEELVPYLGPVTSPAQELLTKLPGHIALKGLVRWLLNWTARKVLRK